MAPSPWLKRWRPGMQLTQELPPVAAPRSVSCPAPQLEHEVNGPPIGVEILPASHRVQSVAWSAENVPAEHRVQCRCSSSLVPAPAYFPAAHGVQSALPSPCATLPAAQMTH